MRNVLFTMSIASALMLAGIHIATWRGFVLSLGLKLFCAGVAAAVAVPAGIEFRLRAADGLEVEVNPMGFVYCAILWLYAGLLWLMLTDQHGGTAAGVAACAQAALWWSRKAAPTQSPDAFGNCAMPRK